MDYLERIIDAEVDEIIRNLGFKGLREDDIARLKKAVAQLARKHHLAGLREGAIKESKTVGLPDSNQHRISTIGSIRTG